MQERVRQMAQAGVDAVIVQAWPRGGGGCQPGCTCRGAAATSRAPVWRPRLHVTLQPAKLPSAGAAKSTALISPRPLCPLCPVAGPRRGGAHPAGGPRPAHPRLHPDERGVAGGGGVCAAGGTRLCRRLRRTCAVPGASEVAGGVGSPLLLPWSSEAYHRGGRLRRSLVKSLCLRSCWQRPARRAPTLMAAPPAVQRGVSRIVVGRELSVRDISKVSAGCGAEVEAFVHGALCVSYSGQVSPGPARGGPGRRGPARDCATRAASRRVAWRKMCRLRG